MPGISKIKGQLRQGQLVGTYGVGAIVPLDEESFMIAGTDKWPVNTPNLFEPRLQRVLNVQGFMLPPASPSERPRNDVPVVRFPRMYFCPGCKRLAQHKFFTSPIDNRCNSCPDKPTLVPSRFVAACSLGHIDDFPYFEWVHKGTTPNEA